MSCGGSAVFERNALTSGLNADEIGVDPLNDSSNPGNPGNPPVPNNPTATPTPVVTPVPQCINNPKIIDVPQLTPGSHTFAFPSNLPAYVNSNTRYGFFRKGSPHIGNGLPTFIFYINPANVTSAGIQCNVSTTNFFYTTFSCEDASQGITTFAIVLPQDYEIHVMCP